MRHYFLQLDSAFQSRAGAVFSNRTSWHSGGYDCLFTPLWAWTRIFVWASIFTFAPLRRKYRHINFTRKFGGWICNGHEFTHDILFVTFQAWNFTIGFHTDIERLNLVAGCGRVLWHPRTSPEALRPSAPLYSNESFLWHYRNENFDSFVILLNARSTKSWYYYCSMTKTMLSDEKSGSGVYTLSRRC